MDLVVPGHFMSAGDVGGNFKNAGGFSAAAGAMAAIGIIHSSSLHGPELSGITIGYFVIALFLLIYPRLVEVEHMDDGEPAD